MRSRHQADPTLLAALVLLAMPATGWAAAPVKPEATRKAFDYRRPDPGEILPNPTAGVGTPPQLREYAPSAAMSDDAGPAPQNPGPAPQSPAAAAADAGSPPPAAEPAPAAASPKPAGRDAGATAPPAPPVPTPPPPMPPSRVQALFAAEVVRSGIDGIGAAAPATAGQPALAAAWSTLAGSLERSDADWAKRLPGRTPAALDRVETVTAPGQVTITAAPGRLTGAFDDTPP